MSPDFLCYDNSTCVKEYKVCDGRQDCPGNDDELQCGMLLSLIKLFLNAFPEYGQNHRWLFFLIFSSLISQHIVCSHSLTLFLSSECDPQKEFACSPLLGSSLGQCISLAFVCDGVEQCLNGRDEADCCNNYCDDGVTCIQDDRDGIQCGLTH